MPDLHIVGAGLAGSEAAFQAADLGVRVRLYEMRPERSTPAHKTGLAAELVCSNSFRGNDPETQAVGLLKEELNRLGSLFMQAAEKARLPAGGALAVDRDVFSQHIEDRLNAHPNIERVCEEIKSFPGNQEEIWVFATGPLTSPDLARALEKESGQTSLAFFDALAPIVYRDSIDFSKAWFQSRYDKGEGKDYINLALDKKQYGDFVERLQQAEVTEFRDWEKDTPYFEGCLPIEVMAARGAETLRFGPMKPVGLTNPHSSEAPYAVIQLRQDNLSGSLYNMVGFQTKLRHARQVEIFRRIPGLEGAEFARLGGIHRNLFMNSPRLLNQELGLKARPNLFFAGQMIGVEGYVESAATGWLAGRFAAARLGNTSADNPPDSTAIGALLAHVTCNARPESFQPMNINFGLFPDLEQPERPTKRKISKKQRRQAVVKRARKALDDYLGTL